MQSMLSITEMAKHLARNCPRCGDFFGVILGKPLPDSIAFPIKGCCMRCGYQIDWKLIPGSGGPRKRYGPFESDPIRDV
jgi:hypothetical protein